MESTFRQRYPFIIWTLAVLLVLGVLGCDTSSGPGPAPTSSPVSGGVDTFPARRTPSSTRRIPSAPTATRAVSTPAVPQLVEALVVSVVDGDTLDVRLGDREYRLRIIGVDTPETVHPELPVQCFGKEASEETRRLVEASAWQVLLEKDVSETDRYGRLLRYVWLVLPRGRIMLNEELVRGGYAQVSTFPPDVRYQELFLQAEREARANGRGFWGRCGSFGAPAATPTTEAPTPPPLPTETPVPPPPTPTEVPPPPTETAAPIPATELPAPPPLAPSPPESTPTPDLPAPTQPLPTPEEEAGASRVRIARVFYDGTEPRSEGDEYAVIENTGGAPVNLRGYRLNAGDDGQDFRFPPFVLAPGAEVRVYTNRTVEGAFSFGKGTAIWNNSGDCGYLYDASGAQLSEYCYR